MNDFARLYGRRVENPGCGYIALDNSARAWWQSRSGMMDPPHLTDLRALARSIRTPPPRQGTAA